MNDSTDLAFESLSGEQRLVLQSLVAAGVRFVIIGGYAMRYHGHRRKTSDLDLVLASTLDNVAKLKAALCSFTSDDMRLFDNFLLPEKKVIWWNVDLLSSTRGTTYSELESAAKPAQIFGQIVLISSTRHLRAEKLLALSDPDRRKKWTVDSDDLAYLDRLQLT